MPHHPYPHRARTLRHIARRRTAYLTSRYRDVPQRYALGFDGTDPADAVLYERAIDATLADLGTRLDLPPALLAGAPGSSAAVLRPVEEHIERLTEKHRDRWAAALHALDRLWPTVRTDSP
ncbi:hypothetical protein [Streptomyces sp. NPDC091212]|uniref:hypothetical protein n=1 Tax=Streptomyces sp. NPDC091212 TaxID=3155191 RepID=UPI0034489AF7